MFRKPSDLYLSFHIEVHSYFVGDFLMVIGMYIWNGWWAILLRFSTLYCTYTYIVLISYSVHLGRLSATPAQSISTRGS